MNWYKTAQQIRDFEDRTQVNAKIRVLESIAEMLEYAGHLVYQTGRGARSIVSQISRNKKMSNYDDLQEMLSMAEEVALDNPKKFAILCNGVAKQLMLKAHDLKIDRKRFVEGLAKKGLPPED